MVIAFILLDFVFTGFGESDNKNKAEDETSDKESSPEDEVL